MYANHKVYIYNVKIYNKEPMPMPMPKAKLFIDFKNEDIDFKDKVIRRSRCRWGRWS